MKRAPAALRPVYPLICLFVGAHNAVASGPCNSFYCLGHFKNVHDDDDDDMTATVTSPIMSKHTVKRRHRIYGHDTNAISWV